MAINLDVAVRCAKCGWLFRCPVAQPGRVVCSACERKNTIDVSRAKWLYHVWGNWRLVACRMIRGNGQRFAADAVQAAVRRYNRGPA